MADTSGIRFLSTSLEIQLSSTIMNTEALASPFGVSRLLFPVSMQGQLKTEGPIKIKLGNFDLSATLVQQYTEHGLSYSARFLSPSPEQVAYIQLRIAKEGVHSGWQRRFPRLVVANLKDEPHPQRCTLAWLGKEHSLDVINFTLDGMRLLKTGELPNLKVGKVINISVYPSTGEAITNLEVEVRNFSRLTHATLGEVTEIGLRVTELRSASREAYHGLFRNCLLTLQKRKP